MTDETVTPIHTKTATIPMSDRPADELVLEVDRVSRCVTLRDVNGAHLATVSCPAVQAGARPEDLQE